MGGPFQPTSFYPYDTWSLAGAAMRRRDFIALVGGVAAWPLAVRAQQPAMALVGLLSSAQLDDRQIDAIRQGLKHAGYIEGRNVAVKYRSADSRFDRLPALAADLIADPVTAIIALAPPAAVAAKAATTAIPIVFAIGADPVDLGLVSNFSHPGGNITGVTFVSNTLSAKRLELVRELVPGATIIGLLVNPGESHFRIPNPGCTSCGARIGRPILDPEGQQRTRNRRGLRECRPTTCSRSHHRS